MAFLLTLLSCKPRSTTTQAGETQGQHPSLPQQNLPDNQTGQVPGSGLDREEAPVTRSLNPETPFPLEDWRIQYRPETHLIPRHERLGPMGGLILEENQILLYEKTRELLDNWPNLEDSHLYGPSRTALRIKLEQQWGALDNLVYLIGEPVIQGSTGEVILLMENNPGVIRLYWYFQEVWLLEDLDF